MILNRNQFLRKLVDSLYSRNEIEFDRGNFRVLGETVDVFLAYSDFAYRFIYFGDEIEEIESFDPITGKIFQKHEEVKIYPANIFVTTKSRMQKAIYAIQDDMVKQVDFLRDIGKVQEAKRLEDRVTYDLEMIRELGYCRV